VNNYKASKQADALMPQEMTLCSGRMTLVSGRGHRIVGESSATKCGLDFGASPGLLGAWVRREGFRPRPTRRGQSDDHECWPGPRQPRHDAGLVRRVHRRVPP
jgi:hypothetical protein